MKPVISVLFGEVSDFPREVASAPLWRDEFSVYTADDRYVNPSPTTFGRETMRWFRKPWPSRRSASGWR